MGAAGRPSPGSSPAIEPDLAFAQLAFEMGVLQLAEECLVSDPLIESRIALSARDTAGTIGIVENVVRPGWPGPPLHHHAFDETFSILEGELTFQLGAERVLGHAGDTLFVAGGIHHTLANLSAAPARYLLTCTPGGFEQRFGPDADSTPSGPNTDIIVVGPRIPEMDAQR